MEGCAWLWEHRWNSVGIVDRAVDMAVAGGEWLEVSLHDTQPIMGGSWETWRD